MKGHGRENADYVTQRWYSEKDNGAHCMRHYTTLVWKSSVKFCMTFAVSKDGGYYTVERYFPAGNWNADKYYRANVHPAFVSPC